MTKLEHYLTLNLVVEDRIIECESQPHWMSGIKLVCNFGGFFVSLVRFIDNTLLVLLVRNLGQVTLVVALHLHVEHLGDGK